jgi:hypothetical protein
MNLHANAALSLNKRRLLCLRVVDEQWTLTKAAEAAEVSVRCANGWAATAPRASWGCWIGRRRPPRWPTAPASGASG